MTNPNKISIFYPLELFDEKQRGYWFELIKSKERLSRKESEMDEIIQARLDWKENPEEADLWILPLDWAYYFRKNLEQKAFAFCFDAQAQGKTVLSFSGGDQGMTLDLPENVVVYRQSGYRSTLRKNERIAPFFLSDPVGKFVPDEAALIHRKTNEKPTVGFCGMAPHGLMIELKERMQVFLRNKKSKAGQMHFDAQEVMSSSNLRYKTLQVFVKDSRFHANYIVRQKYRGGEQTAENRKKTTFEYYNNQLESDLITCVRGVGNFSLRFYETLAMGRIPVFIDTDSPLPNIGDKNWHDYVIWVDRKDVKNTAEITAKWLADKDLTDQFKKSRELWQQYMRLDGFWLNELATVNPKINEVS